jgi:F0F1-type ATP synthase membrane subunit b/b'
MHKMRVNIRAILLWALLLSLTATLLTTPRSSAAVVENSTLRQQVAQECGETPQLLDFWDIDPQETRQADPPERVREAFEEAQSEYTDCINSLRKEHGEDARAQFQKTTATSVDEESRRERIERFQAQFGEEYQERREEIRANIEQQRSRTEQQRQEIKKRIGNRRQELREQLQQRREAIRSEVT